MDATQALVEVSKILVILNATYGNREFPLSNREKSETMAAVWARKLCRFDKGTIEAACEQATNHKDPPNLKGIESLCETIQKHKRSIAMDEERRRLESKVAHPRVANYYIECQRRMLVDAGGTGEEYHWLGKKRGRVPTIDELNAGREKLRRDGHDVRAYASMIKTTDRRDTA